MANLFKMQLAYFLLYSFDIFYVIEHTKWVIGRSDSLQERFTYLLLIETSETKYTVSKNWPQSSGSSVNKCQLLFSAQFL